MFSPPAAAAREEQFPRDRPHLVCTTSWPRSFVQACSTPHQITSCRWALQAAAPASAAPSPLLPPACSLLPAALPPCAAPAATVPTPASCPQLTGVCGVSGYGASTGAGNWLVQIYRCGTSSCQVGVNLPQGKCLPCASHIASRKRTASGLAMWQAAHLRSASCASHGAPLSTLPAHRLTSPCRPCHSVGQHAADVCQRDSGPDVHAEPRRPSLLQRQLLHSQVHVLRARCVGG